MLEISCGACGCKRDAVLWMETLSGVALPENQYQCPECKVAIKLNSEPSEVVDINGHTMVIPGAVTIERVESVL